jgi:REP element-mobilizing transposase RayT
MHDRKHPVHQPVHEQYGRSRIIFLTVCTKGRKRILADPVIHLHLVRAWQNAGAWLIGRYVIMPDHLHLFCAPAELHETPLIRWVSYWKAWSAIRWPKPNDSPVWQRHFWDTQLRRGQNYDEKWEYVVQNPVRAELVQRPEDWPLQGELNILQW